MKPCFQINSKKLEKELLFRDEEDYIYGINTLALILLQFPEVVVYAFTLMSNHIHLLLGGPIEQCVAFYDAVMHRLSLRLKRKYGLSGVVPYGKENRETVPVHGLEHFIIEVLYLLRNPFKAKICYPGDYPWSSVGMYFSKRGLLAGLPMELKFNDREIAARVQAICQNELNVKDHCQLPTKELLRLCRTLSIRFGTSAEQLQRVLGVDKSLLEDWL